MMSSSISIKKLRYFGYIIGFSFPTLIGWVLAIIAGTSFKEWTLLIGVLFLIVGIIRPGLLRYPFKVVMAFLYGLSWINSHIFLVIFFLVVLQHVALLAKFFRYDPLKKRQSYQGSYREDKKIHKIDLTRTF